MNNDVTKKRQPSSKAAALFSVITAVLYIVMALLLLDSAILLLYYFVTTLIATLIVLALKIHFLLPSIKNTPENNLESKAKLKARVWKKILLTFGILLIITLSPVILAGVLDPHSWFIFVISLASSFSFSEIIVYFHTRL